MSHRTRGLTRRYAPLLAVFLVSIFVVVFVAGFWSITTIQPAGPVNTADVSMEIEQNETMTVHAYFLHKVDYVLVVTADGDETKLHGVGDRVNIDPNGEDVRVYKVVDEDVQHIQTLEYHEPHNTDLYPENGGYGFTIGGTIG